MHHSFRNVNYAFESMVRGIESGDVPTQASPSRYGDVLRINGPVTITYEDPRERVLFAPGRDCNPFFHLFEALWMLAGRNDLAPIVYFNSKMKEFSDDGGITQPDAYGYRWRKHFGWDQLNAIVEELKKDHTSRRVVLSMWDPVGAAWGHHDFHKATHGSKGVPCNTNAYFDIVDGHLDMTVCNRSNDMIWGMFGANVVHFSMLQEYLACCIGVEVGMYHQFTNNLHVYKNTWDPEKFLQTGHGTAEYADVAAPGSMVGPLLVKNKEVFDREVQEFIDHWHDGVYTEPFLQTVAKPMCVAFKLHKLRDYRTAHVALQQCQALDWYTAGYYWLRRREEAWKLKSATSAVQG